MSALFFISLAKASHAHDMSEIRMPPPKPASSQKDDIDYNHRNLVNLLAVIFLLSVALASVWVIKAMEEHEALRRCIDAGRRDCALLNVAQPVRNVVIINH